MVSMCHFRKTTAKDTSDKVEHAALEPSISMWQKATNFLDTVPANIRPYVVNNLENLKGMVPLSPKFVDGVHYLLKRHDQYPNEAEYKNWAQYPEPIRAAVLILSRVISLACAVLFIPALLPYGLHVFIVSALREAENNLLLGIDGFRKVVIEDLDESESGLYQNEEALNQMTSLNLWDKTQGVFLGIAELYRASPQKDEHILYFYLNQTCKAIQLLLTYITLSLPLFVLEWTMSLLTAALSALALVVVGLIKCSIAAVLSAPLFIADGIQYLYQKSQDEVLPKTTPSTEPEAVQEPEVTQPKL